VPLTLVEDGKEGGKNRSLKSYVFFFGLKKKKKSLSVPANVRPKLWRQQKKNGIMFSFANKQRGKKGEQNDP